MALKLSPTELRALQGLITKLQSDGEDVLNSGEAYNTTISARNTQYNFTGTGRKVVDQEFKQFLARFDKLQAQQAKSRGRQKLILGLAITVAATYFLGPQVKPHMSSIASTLGGASQAKWKALQTYLGSWNLAGTMTGIKTWIGSVAPAAAVAAVSSNARANNR